MKTLVMLDEQGGKHLELLSKPIPIIPSIDLHVNLRQISSRSKLSAKIFPKRRLIRKIRRFIVTIRYYLDRNIKHDSSSFQLQ